MSNVVTPMRVLMLCTKYPLDPEDKYLTNELADALVVAGHHVEVVATNWNAPLGAAPLSTRGTNGIQILVLAPRGLPGLGRFVERATKWIFSSFLAQRQMRRALNGRSFDLLICFTPCVTVAAQLMWASKHFRTRNLLLIHDFFPYHHRSIGLMVSGPVFNLALWLENFLIRKFNVIGCMSPMNVSYLRRHYRILNHQRAEVFPLWGSTQGPPPVERRAIRIAYGLPVDGKIAVFGGQMTEGRGVENILEAATILKDQMPELTVLMIGEGRLSSLVENHIKAGGNNVFLRNRISRSQYLSLLTACDIGIVCTIAGVDVPTFPSKTIDYLRAGVPILAAVEDTTDYGDFLRNNGIGLALQAGDSLALADALKRIAADDNLAAAMKKRGRSCLVKVFDVKRAVKQIEDMFAT